MKKFFDNLRKDAKFKQAGSGKKLTATSADTSRKRGRAKPTERRRRSPSGDAKLAGEAALARSEAQHKKEVDWSHQAIKARAKREMEAEKQLAELSIGPTQSEMEDPYCKDPNQLAVDGVYFHCQFIGDEVNTYEVTKENIRQLLYSQLPEDPAVVSCLIIHSCNKGKQKITECIEILCKCIDNIVQHPTEEKYRRIRLSTRTYQERIAPMEGAKEFLQTAGFTEQILPHNNTTESFWVFPENKLSDLQSLESLRDSLISAEPLKPQLDRDVRVLFPQQARQFVELPREFFNLTADELRREIQLRKDEGERREMMMTKAMREKLEVKEIKKYKFTLVRVRFANQIILQGTFSVYEKFLAVKEFVQMHLSESERPFNLLFGSSGKINSSEEDRTLFDLRMVPNILFNFEWKLSGAATSEEDDYLNEETMQLLE